MTRSLASIPPRNVRAAGATWCRRTSRPVLDPGAAERGDIRIAAPADRHGARRLVLVTAVDMLDGAAAVALVHSSPEMATSVDAVVTPSSAGIAHPVVVQTDLVGCVWKHQLGRRVGRIAPGAAQAAVSGGLVVGDVTTGLSLRGVLDGRWAFKAAEGRALRRLTVETTEALLARLV